MFSFFISSFIFFSRTWDVIALNCFPFLATQNNVYLLTIPPPSLCSAWQVTHYLLLTFLYSIYQVCVTFSIYQVCVTFSKPSFLYVPHKFQHPISNFKYRQPFSISIKNPSWFRSSIHCFLSNPLQNVFNMSQLN